MMGDSLVQHIGNYQRNTEVRSTFEDYRSIENFRCKYYTENEFVSELARHKGLSFMHVNISSLVRNFEGLSHIVNNFKDLKVIGISESRIKKENLHSSNLEILGYSMLFHPTEAAAEGTVLYISDSLAFKPREDLSSFTYKPTFIEIECKKKANIIVGCVYKHPVMQTKYFGNL